MARTAMQYLRLSQSRPEETRSPDRAGSRSKSLYVSHFLSTWNSRGFEFGAVLFLASIYPGTLRPMSVYALVRSFAAIVLSPAVGRHIDRSDRLPVIRSSILGQRLAVASSCVLFLCLLFYKDILPSIASDLLFLILVLLACVEKICIIMNTIAVERDWVVVIAVDNEALLGEMNSQMRRIDLFCKLVSPLAIALLDGVSSTVAVSATLAINIVSSLVEYILIAWVYKKTPVLSKACATQENAGVDVLEASSWYAWPRQVMSSVLNQANFYTRSHAFLPSLSLSMLYLTVLSFSGQMITFLFTIEHPRLDSTSIGILRTIATVLEISSTYIAPLLIHQVGPVRAGIWSLSWQFLTLTPGVATFWMPSTMPSAARTLMFITSVILSRIGLWSFDLTAQLLVQNSVDASQRGAFSATESSLQNAFELCTFAMTIIWSKPQQFMYPATVSLGAVYAAAVVYARFVRVERGHLLHLPECCTYGSKYEMLEAEDDRELGELHRI